MSSSSDNFFRLKNKDEFTQRYLCGFLGNHDAAVNQFKLYKESKEQV